MLGRRRERAQVRDRLPEARLEDRVFLGRRKIGLRHVRRGPFELAQLAEDSFTTAMIHLPKGARVQQEASMQLLNAIPQYTRAVEGQKKNFCKGNRG